MVISLWYNNLIGYLCGITMNREELMEWSIVELKEYCKSLGLKVGGCRVKLVDRILEEGE